MYCPKCENHYPFIEGKCIRYDSDYLEMVDDIRHDEIKSLIEKMEKLTQNNESVEAEERLLSRELSSSTLLIPVIVEGNKIQTMSVSDEDGNLFLLLFTDREEYDKNVSGIDPMVNTFEAMLGILNEQFKGFVINVDGQSWVIDRDFIKRYFSD